MSYSISTVCSLLVCTLAMSEAQQSAPNLKVFIEKRLSDKSDAAPPSYEALLAVVDGIGKTAPSDIQAVLPSLAFALKSKTPNVPVEAVFAFFEISRRPDGGALLRNSAIDIAAVMASPDDRLSGGAVTILRQLTRSIPDTTIPLLVSELRGPRRPSMAKAEIVRTLLESVKRGDEQVQGAIEAYLATGADPKVRAENLHAIRTNRFKTPAIAAYVIGALHDKDKHVQIAAIQTAYVLGSDVRDQARPIMSKLASDPSVDQEVRSIAGKALQNKLTDPYKVLAP
jgi:hypothetical protein